MGFHVCLGEGKACVGFRCIRRLQKRDRHPASQKDCRNVALNKMLRSSRGLRVPERQSFGTPVITVLNLFTESSLQWTL